MSMPVRPNLRNNSQEETKAVFGRRRVAVGDLAVPDEDGYLFIVDPTATGRHFLSGIE
jgi:hypothetical protein